MADVLAVVGSVRFACAERGDIAMAHLVAQIVGDELVWRRPDLVVSGGADGVDTWGVQTAAEVGVPYREFLPKHRRWAPDGFKARNLRIVEACSRLLAIRCAEATTYGSGWTFDRARERGKPVRLVRISSVGEVDDSGWMAPNA
jgi:hypothetical protein